MKLRRIPRLHILSDLRQFSHRPTASSHFRWRPRQVKQPVRTLLGFPAARRFLMILMLSSAVRGVLVAELVELDSWPSSHRVGALLLSMTVNARGHINLCGNQLHSYRGTRPQKATNGLSDRMKEVEGVQSVKNQGRKALYNLLLTQHQPDLMKSCKESLKNGIMKSDRVGQSKLEV